MAGFDFNQGLLGATTFGSAGFSMGGPYGALAAIPGFIYSGFAGAEESPYDKLADAANPMYKQIGQSVYSAMSRAGRETAEEAKKRMYQQGFGGQIVGAGFKKDIQNSQKNAYDAGQNAIFNAVDNNFGKYTQGKAQERETEASFRDNLAKSAISAAMFAYMKQGDKPNKPKDPFEGLLQYIMNPNGGGNWGMLKEGNPFE